MNYCIFLQISLINLFYYTLIKLNFIRKFKTFQYFDESAKTMADSSFNKIKLTYYAVC